jgi:hypothetical protein
MRRRYYGDESSELWMLRGSGAHQEHVGLDGMAGDDLVRRNWLMPTPEKTMSSASISGTPTRFLPWA